MNIIINTLADVTIDGNPQGGVVDALFHAASAGNEAIRAPMLDALTAFVAAAVAKASAATTAVQAELTDAKAQAQKVTAGFTAVIDQLKIDGANAVAAANGQRDAVIAQSQQLAQMARATAAKRKALDSEYDAVAKENDAIIDAANKSYDERVKSELLAQQAAVAAELAKYATPTAS